MMTTKIPKLAIVVLVAALLALPGSALAQSPTSAEYNSTSHQVAAGGGGSPGGGPTAGSSGSSHIAGLPFTGLDLVVLLAAGAALLGTGVGLRRRTDPSRGASSQS